MKLKNDAPVTLALLGAGTRGEFDLGYFMEKLRNATLVFLIKR